VNALLTFRKEWLGADVLAGLTVAAVVIPKAMAYATVAGLPVQVGLYTAFLPMVIYALLGTSRALSVSTTTTLAILAGADLAELARAGDPASLARAAATMTFLVGGILVLASILRLGFVASFISEPVLVGFKAGIGLVIVFIVSAIRNTRALYLAEPLPDAAGSTDPGQKTTPKNHETDGSIPLCQL